MEILRRNSDHHLIEHGDAKENSENYLINKYLNSIIEKEGFVNCKVYKKVISTGGANYLSSLRQIDVKGVTREGNKEINLFLKLKMSDSNQNTITNFTDIFTKEAYIYNNFNFLLNNLQKEAGIPAQDRYNMVKCYEESDESAIILENLAKKGYKTLHRMEVMPLKFMELSIIQLAKFHGLSFVLKEKMPNYLEDKRELFTYPVLYNDDWKKFVENICKQGVEHVESNFRSKINNTIPKIIEKFPKYMTGELASVKCLCHGDYRPSNILTKVEEGEVLDVIPVDYQTLFYGSPIIDFLYFINSSTDRQFRKQHLVHLKDLYYESLKRFLDYFHIEVYSVYARKQFEQDFNDYFDYGLIVSIHFFPFFFVLEDEDVPDLENDSLVDMRVKLGQTFKERMEGVILDHIDVGHL